MDLKYFKDYLAGYLLYKQTDSFQLMNVSEYFSYRMDNSDNADLLKPDLLVLNFSGIFFNKAAPIFIMQICDERLALAKKTWLVSGLSRHDLEIGFKESKDIFNDFLTKIDLRTFNNKKKRFSAGKNIFSSSISETPKTSWKSSL
jgi:DNA-binding beta-propeller fold protein YncE